MTATTRLVMAAEPEVALVTLSGIELIEVGEDWETSTGVFTFTTEDLVSAIGSQDDPGVRSPVIKLGHTDPRFDGQPTIGRIQNLILANNDQTLIGDLVGVPAWLAKVMWSAYPRRSVEGWFDATTRTGNEWQFILTGVALLGATYPAIDTLEDLAAMWGAEPPELVPVEDNATVLASDTGRGLRFVALRSERVRMPEWIERRDPAEVAAAADGVDNASPIGDAVQAADDREANEIMPGGKQVRAAVSVEDIRRAYYDTLGPGEYWWWIREVRVNPAELIVDTDEGDLMRVPYFLADDDTITFGDAVEVKIEYVDVAAGALQVPKVGAGQAIAAKYGDPDKAGRPERKPAAATDGDGAGTTPEPAGSPQVPPGSATMPSDDTQGGAHEMKLSDEAIRRLGLDPAKATEDEINAAILASVTEDDPAGGDGDPGNGTPDQGGDATETGTQPAPASTPGGEGGMPATPPTPPAPPEGEGTETADNGTPQPVLVDAAQWREAQLEIAAARERRLADEKADRERLVSAAVRDGRIAKSSKDGWIKKLEVEGDMGKQALASLTPGLLPVTEIGRMGDGDTEQPGTGPGEAYPEGWSKSVTASQRGIGRRVKVVAD